MPVEGRRSQKLIMPPCNVREHCWNPLNCSQPYCPLSSSATLPFTFDLAFLTYWSCSAAALTHVDKEGRRRGKKSVRLLVKKLQTEAHTRVLYTQYIICGNICLPSNVASKAACYLDCISFLIIQLWYGTALLQWMTHPPSTPPEKSTSLSPSCPNNTSVFLPVWIIKWRQMIRQKSCTTTSPAKNSRKLRPYRRA